VSCTGSRSSRGARRHAERSRERRDRVSSEPALSLAARGHAAGAVISRREQRRTCPTACLVHAQP
jgi:hypothetical protein